MPVLDVRAPAEYGHAHMPGAHHLPLFDDEERKVVGTLYKQQGREAAIKAGLDFFGPRMRAMVTAAEDLMAEQHSPPGGAAGRRILLHCWRGGMRSAAVAWLLDLYGFTVYTLKGGYQSFRRYVLETFTLPFDIRVLGGYTGSGKTSLLHTLGQQGASVIDLERLAGHRGSAFGGIGLPPQPSQEMFENRLALALRKAAATPVWMEDESRRIGQVNIPGALWEQLHHAPLYFLDIPFPQRLDNLLQSYGNAGSAELEQAILRIRKRLGGLETQKATQALQQGDLKGCFRILLQYYDKYYRKSLSLRPDSAQVRVLQDAGTDPALLAEKLAGMAAG
ncbi:tRNA 2-selenouridine(34) synthase MnmH [Compostibacter hankyongensis]|uniref:tRNA 2-selenouridine(34) synthase MnmH n=2 Tax=Compostibacter hankyongensis TaxID=1007089 RepID=A0ABP8FE15_9BACT